MSSIYIQEPPTNGKVILKTTIGEICIELWSKECPKACRNFVQLCLDGYYDGTIFHRIVKDFIAQGGDPTGTGEGGESIYGHPFKDEFHQRLRFNRRGLVGMANSDKDDNGSQFFFTLGTCQELNKKHTLFGKVAGQTIYNMIKLNECEVIDERPTRAEKIISTEVVANPFDDVKPRNIRAVTEKKPDDASKNKKGVKNYALLSFGEEAEDDEEDLENISKEFKEKPKSAHDIGDPSLLSKKIDSKPKDDEEKSEDEIEETNTSKVDIESIKSKLKKKQELKDSTKIESKNDKIKESDPDLIRKKTQEEIKKLEKELSTAKKVAEKEESEQDKKTDLKKEEIEVVEKYKQEVEKYEHLKNVKKAKSHKEDKTLELLNAFRDRLFKAKTVENQNEDNENGDEKKIDSKETVSEDASLKSILTHRLEIDEEIHQKVIDANIADNERYDIYDPRNPLNKRKREESKEAMKNKKSYHSSSSLSFKSNNRY